MDKYTIEKEIGRGTYGIVYLATKEGVNYAIKDVVERSRKFEYGYDPNLIRENDILLRNLHPNVINAVEIIPEDKVIHIVMPYADGSLHDVIHAINKNLMRPLSFRTILEIIGQLMCGLAYLHSNGIVHMDIKPENILIIDNVFKLTDFGLSLFCIKNTCKAGSIGGTPHYMPPEAIYNKDKFISSKTDIWAMGIIIYKLCIGKDPYNVIRKYDPIYFANNSSLYSTGYPEIDTIVQMCTRLVPENRASATDILALIDNYHNCIVESNVPVSYFEIPKESKSLCDRRVAIKMFINSSRDVDSPELWLIALRIYDRYISLGYEISDVNPITFLNACVWIATKLVTISNMSRIPTPSYYTDDLPLVEKLVLERIQWDVGYPTAFTNAVVSTGIKLDSSSMNDIVEFMSDMHLANNITEYEKIITVFKS